MEFTQINSVFLSPEANGGNKGGPPPGKIGTETITRGPVIDAPKGPGGPLPQPHRPGTEIKKGK